MNAANWTCAICDGGPGNHCGCSCPNGPVREFPSDRETGTVERLVARAECMNGAMKAGGLYLRLGDYTDEDAALDREAASELTRLKARADAADEVTITRERYEKYQASEANLATAREALKEARSVLRAWMVGNLSPEEIANHSTIISLDAALRLITEGADHERS